MNTLWGFHRWTRHSLVLVVAGLIYIGIGVGFLLAPPQVSMDPSLKFALRLLSMNGWGIVYLISGSTAMLSATWPAGAEKWGYTVLTGLSSGWAAMYAIPVIYGIAPPVALISTLIWSLLAFIWWAVSGLISPQFVEAVIEDARRSRDS